MITKRTRGLAIGSLLPLMLLGGCVSRSDYDALQSQNQQLQQQVTTQSAQIAADKVSIGVQKGPPIGVD